MKKIIIAIVLAAMMVCSTCFAGQRFELYPTDNFNTVLKLDTSTGKVWQVHIAVGADAVVGQHEVNSLNLTDNPYNNRFILQKTGNMYNFVLCDTDDGRCWQVQWSFKPENRGIIPIR